MCSLSVTLQQQQYYQQQRHNNRNSSNTRNTIHLVPPCSSYRRNSLHFKILLLGNKFAPHKSLFYKWFVDPIRFEHLNHNSRTSDLWIQYDCVCTLRKFTCSWFGDFIKESITSEHKVWSKCWFNVGSTSPRNSISHSVILTWSCVISWSVKLMLFLLNISPSVTMNSDKEFQSNNRGS